MWLALLALGGLLSGHLASYTVVAPDAHERARLLASTGHSAHSLSGTVALAALLAGVIGVACHLVRARSTRRVAPLNRARVAAFLWVLQTAGFVALETWERGHGLAGLPHLLHEPPFLVGLVAQLAVALVATAVVLLVRATVGALLRLFVVPCGDSEAPALEPAPAWAPRASVARAAWNLRGPPSPAGSRT